jgi:hypothetical protein
MTPFQITNLGQTPGSELITQTCEQDGYRIVMSQEFLEGFNGGGYFYAIFDPSGNLRNVSPRDCLFLPMASHSGAQPPSGRISPELAQATLSMIVPKLRAIDERENRASKNA